MIKSVSIFVFVILAIISQGLCDEYAKPVEFNSDVRFRDEFNKGRVSVGDTAVDDITQNKIRIRLRSEMSKRINEFFRGGFRIVTGYHDEERANKHSTHADANSRFEKFPVSIDRAYLDILVNEELVLHLGKFGNPFRGPGIYNEVIWDNDIQPEGMALEFNHITVENDWVKSGGFVASMYFLDNFENGKDPAYLTADQAFITLPVLKAMEVTLGSGAYFFFNAHSKPDTRYQILDNFITTDVISSPIPLRFKFQWIYNWMTDHDNMGYVIGASINKVKKLGDVSASYHGQFIDDNAVDPEFAQDDFKKANNMWGHELAMKVGLAEAVDMKFRVIVTNWTRDQNFFRGRVEFNAKF